MSDAEIYASLTPHKKAIWDGKTDHTPEQRAAFVARWKGEQYERVVRSRASNCVHFLGEEHPDGVVTCPTCKGGGVKLKTFKCAVYGRCTVGRKAEGVAGCCSAKCTAYEEPVPLRHPCLSQPVGKLHLLYHLLPVADNGVWQWNVEQLRKRWHLFTGRKIIAVMTADESFKREKQQGGDTKTRFTLDDAAIVRSALPADAEVIEIENNPQLREVASWQRLWSKLHGENAADAVFYAHAKGVTRPGSVRWAEVMYETLLDRMPEGMLNEFPIVGSFRKVGKAFGSSKWHYSGSFFVARLGDFFTRNWRKIRKEWWGNEGWPGENYLVREAGCVFKPIEGALDLFNADVWANVEKEYAEWRGTGS